jgi:hypothetical protein
MKREPQGEGCALVDVAAELDVPFVVLYDIVADRKIDWVAVTGGSRHTRRIENVDMVAVGFDASRVCYLYFRIFIII